MRKVERWLAMALVLLLFCLAGCDTGVPKAPSAVAATVPTSMPSTTPATGAEIALLVTEETAESEYGQGVWSAISRVAGELAATSGLYRTPKAADEQAALATMELAVKGGARLVVLLGADLGDMARQAVKLYPDVDFILLDIPYDTPLPKNTVQVHYSPEESGWLAGYASVYEELGNLGFAAPQTEEESRYLLGFLLGADAAAQDRNAPAGAVQVYQLPVNVQKEVFAESLRLLYQPEGPAVRTFFSSQSKVLEMALPVAQAAKGYLAGPAPLPDAGETLLAGVMHDPQNLFSVLLASWVQGRFPGGETVEGTITGGEVGLILPKEGLGSFNAQRYQTVQDRFRIGGLSTKLARQTAPDETGALPLPESLPLNVLRVVPPVAEVASLLPPQSGASIGSIASASESTPAASALSAAPAVSFASAPAS